MSSARGARRVSPKLGSSAMRKTDDLRTGDFVANRAATDIQSFGRCTRSLLLTAWT